jgi:hypothetical protein
MRENRNADKFWFSGRGLFVVLSFLCISFARIRGVSKMSRKAMDHHCAKTHKQ